MEITPLTVKIADLPVTALDREGNVALLLGVDVTLMPRNVSPNQDSVWVSTAYSEGVATFTIAGHQAEVNGTALRVPYEGGVIWARAVDTPEVSVVAIEEIDVL